MGLLRGEGGVACLWLWVWEGGLSMSMGGLVCGMGQGPWGRLFVAVYHSICTWGELDSVIMALNMGSSDFG